MYDLLDTLVRELKKLDIRSSRYRDPSFPFPDYPPVRYRSERIWTSTVLSQKKEITKLLKTCGINGEIAKIKPEYLNIDIVIFLKNNKIISVEAMDQNGLCDDNHFEKGINSYPQTIGEKCCHAILLAAKFENHHVKKCLKESFIKKYELHLVTCNFKKNKVHYNKINN